MALTGNTVQSTYLDLVQLEKSGAGLPSHAGKEAALYDGSGAQIVGRTAQRHWLDPHPDAAAFAETWEFSTTGDMTQGQLETAGWTFTNCTGVVSNGIMWITKANAASLVFYASLDVSYAGDFDIVMTPCAYMGYDAGTFNRAVGGFGVADYRAGTADKAHYGLIKNNAAAAQIVVYTDGAYTTMAGATESDNLYGAGLHAVRIWRYSSAVEINGASFNITNAPALIADDSNPNFNGWVTSSPASDASTYNKLFVTATAAVTTDVGTFGVANIRRFQ